MVGERSVHITYTSKPQQATTRPVTAKAQAYPSPPRSSQVSPIEKNEQFAQWLAPQNSQRSQSCKHARPSQKPDRLTTKPTTNQLVVRVGSVLM